MLRSGLLFFVRGIVHYTDKFVCMSARLGKRKARKHHTISLDPLKGAKKQKFSFKMDCPVTTEKSHNKDMTYLSNPTQSENDKKNYRVLQLINGMRILLISDPSISENEPKIPASGVDNMAYSSAEESDEETDNEEGGSSDVMSAENADETTENEEEESELEPESVSSNDADSGVRKHFHKEGDRMAAAALCVKVGSFSDPADLPGLAHFLEHMVFMGSNNYPEENAFDEFLKTYGGSSNASTDCETTTFEFEVHQRHFHEALAIFAQFFASPLLLPESMKREKEAVDSEFQMALPSDSCRKQQLFGSLAKPDHPMAKFMWGNSQTLNLPNDPEGVELNRRLRLFWQQNYTADRMTVVMQSKHDLDQMEEWAATVFRDIPPASNDIHANRLYDFANLSPPFDTPEFHRIVQIIPVKDVSQVCLTWALPSQLKHYRTKPLGYLSWLIGHEGKGSLLAYLRRKVWALDLASGNDESGFDHNSTYASFSINISLTERGMAELEKVIQAVFQYIEMLKRRGPDERVWGEIRLIEDLSFRFQEDSPPVENVETLSENMHKYPSTDYITGESLLFDYNAEVIASCMHALRTDNVNIMILTKDFEKDKTCDEVEPWFQTHYKSREIPSEWKQLWAATESNYDESPFSIPEANPYLASDFTLLEPPPASSSIFPVKIDCPEDGVSLWFRQDARFRIPKAVLNFYLVSPVASDSARSAVLLELLGKVLKHQLMERVYDALVAQLEFAIHHYDRGLVIKVSGFNHKLHLLIQAIVSQFARFEEDAVVDVFEAIKEQQEKAYRNYCLKPSKLVTDARLKLLHTSHWSLLDRADVVKNLTVDDLKAFAQQLKSTFCVEGLVQGNYSKEQAIQVALDLKSQLQPGKRVHDALPGIRIRRLPTGATYCRLSSFHPTDSNSALVNYYQVGPTNIHQTCVMEILVNLMEEPVFDVLRTREQLGYNVNVILRNTFGVLGFSITVDFQADKYSASHVDERIEDFLLQFDARLTAMTEDDLQTRVQSLIKLKQLPDVSLDEEVARNWNEILSDEYLFDRLQQEVNHLQRITLDEIRSFYQSVALSSSNSNRRKLSMQVIGASRAQSQIGNGVGNKAELCFLAGDDSKDGSFLKNFDEFHSSAYIYPPLKTFDGLPPVDVNV